MEQDRESQGGMEAQGVPGALLVIKKSGKLE